MKNVALAALALIFFTFHTLTACTARPTGSERPSADIHSVTQGPVVSTTGEPKNTEMIAGDTMTRPGPKATTLTITANNKDFTAAIEDNDTARAFLAKLPLTLDMSDLNGNEKYHNLSDDIRKDASTCPGTIKAGDIMLYGSNCVVVFYKSFRTTYSYVKIGHINDAGNLASTLGRGDVKVSFLPNPLSTE